jgi:hypothetical protein
MNLVCKLAAMGAGLSLMLACGGGTAATPVLHLSVAVTPAVFTIGVGSNLQFTATVSGTTNQDVTWQVNQVTGGNAGVGTISTSGMFIAPVTMPAATVTVTAVAQADGVTSGSAVVTIAATDPLGTAQGTAMNCPSGYAIAGNCYSVVLACPGVADFTAYLKVTSPAGTPLGTVMFTGGGNGTGIYEDYTNGDTAVNNVVAAGFTVVQTSFGGPFTNQTPDGWQTGPGGIRRLACRYATLAQWVYANIHNANASKPLCATGNSAGGQLIAETLTHYGTASIFSMVEPTSGPPFSDMEKACICGADADVPIVGACNATVNQCLAAKDAESYVDPAYSAPICSQALSTHDTTNQALFISDSVQWSGATLSYPHTYLHFVYGGLDTSSAVTLGPDYMNVIINSGGVPATTAACVADAPHSIADALDGAQQIASDIISGCKLY